MNQQALYRVLADTTLVIHFGFVVFVVLGLLVTWLGYFLKWRFVRNFWFRALHILAMGVVVAESVFGVTCPLTTWEHDLRVAGAQTTYEETFMEHWVHKMLFFDLGPSTFTIIYVVFFTALVLSVIVVRPRWPTKRDATNPSGEECSDRGA